METKRKVKINATAIGFTSAFILYFAIVLVVNGLTLYLVFNQLAPAVFPVGTITYAQAFVATILINMFIKTKRDAKPSLMQTFYNLIIFYSLAWIISLWL